MSVSDETTDETTGHLTKPLKRQVIGHSHSTGLSKGDSQVAGYAHPNQIDRKRIERALAQRERYRYVTPQVIPDDEEHGYRIESPCCSRNVEPSGGIIDIALLKYLRPHWLLYRKDHDYSTWVLHSVVDTLQVALEILLPDEERVFWP